MALFDKFKRSRKEEDEVSAPVESLEVDSEHSTEGNEPVPEGSSRASFFDKWKRGKREESSEAEVLESPNQEMDEPEPLEEATEEIGATESQRPSILHKLIPGRKEIPEQNEAEPDSKDLQDEEVLEGSRKAKVSLMDRFKLGLTKTRKNIGDKIDHLIKSSRKLDDEFWEELEDILIQADVGMNTSLELVDKIRSAAAKQKIKDPEEVTGLIKNEITQLLGSNPEPLKITGDKPAVILVVGVNGAGKTTSIAKMAYRLKNENHQVMLAAGDTFRAAAIDQLQIWADRVGVELIKHQEGSIRER